LDEREYGVIKARHEWGIDKSRPLQVIDVSIASESAFEEMSKWLNNGGEPISALFADNDIIAAACIRALKAKGYRIPEDVSIVGYDDMPICTMVDPTLTTIRVMKTEMGKVSAEILDKRIKDLDTFKNEFSGVYRITISTRLIERESVKAYNK